MQEQVKRFLSLKDRLALYAQEVRGKAGLLPPGIEREALLEKARQADAASGVDASLLNRKAHKLRRKAPRPSESLP